MGGCLKLLPQAFRLGRLKHVRNWENALMIPAEDLPNMPEISVEVRRGDVLFMHGFTPHCSQTNTSRLVRWSMDLRFHSSDVASGHDFWPAVVLQSQDLSEEERSFDDW